MKIPLITQYKEWLKNKQVNNKNKTHTLVWDFSTWRTKIPEHSRCGSREQEWSWQTRTSMSKGPSEVLSHPESQLQETWRVKGNERHSQVFEISTHLLRCALTEGTESTCSARTRMWINKMENQASGNGIQRGREAETTPEVPGRHVECIQRTNTLEQGDGGFQGHGGEVGKFLMCFERNSTNLNKPAHMRTHAHVGTLFLT